MPRIIIERVQNGYLVTIEYMTEPAEPMPPIKRVANNEEELLDIIKELLND